MTEKSARNSWTVIEDAALLSVLAICPLLYSLRQSSFFVPKETYAAAGISAALFARCASGPVLSLFRPGIFGKFLLVYTAVSALSVFWSASWYWSVRSTAGVAVAALFYLLAAERCHESSRFARRGLVAIALSGAAVTVLSLLQLAGPGRLLFPKFQGNPQVMYSTFGNDSIVAGYLVIAAPLAAGYAYTIRRRGMVAVCVCALAAITYAVLALQTRTAWVALAVSSAGVLCALAVQRRKEMFGKACKLTIGIACMALLFACVQSIAPRASTDDITIAERVESSFNPAQQGVADRIKVVLAAGGVIRDNPILGGGAGTFGFLAPRYQGEVFETHGRPPVLMPSQVYPFHVHNEFIESVTELGLAGLVLVIGMVIGAALDVKYLWKRDGDSADAFLLIGGTGSVVATVIFAAGHFPFHVISHLTAFLFVVAAIRGYSAEKTSERGKKAAGWSTWVRISAAALAVTAVSGTAVWRMAADRLFWTGYLAEIKSPGEDDDALHRLAAATHLNPWDGEFSASFGLALANRGQFAGALPYLERALESWDMAALHNNLGVVYDRLGYANAAARCRKSATLRDPALGDITPETED